MRGRKERCLQIAVSRIISQSGIHIIRYLLGRNAGIAMKYLYRIGYCIRASG